MAGTVRDLTDQPANCERSLATSGTANEPDIIDPPRDAQWMAVEFASTAGAIQRDGLPGEGSAAETTFLSATLTSGKNRPLSADVARIWPCSGRFAVSSGGTSVTYYLTFYDRRP